MKLVLLRVTGWPALILQLLYIAGVGYAVGFVIGQALNVYAEWTATPILICIGVACP